MKTTTCTLKTVDLPDDCSAVYLLEEHDVGDDVTLTFEASLDDGSTWDEIASGELTDLSHTGDRFKLRATMQRPDEAEEPDGEGVVYWLLGLATTGS